MEEVRCKSCGKKYFTASPGYVGCNCGDKDNYGKEDLVIIIRRNMRINRKGIIYECAVDLK